MKVLVVEDDNITGSCLQQSLTKRGLSCECVLNGEAALAALGMTRYDALVLDVYMPGIDGIEVLRKVRELLPSMNLPVLIVTAGNVGRIAETVSEMPPAAVLAKPYEVTQVIDHLDRLWGK